MYFGPRIIFVISKEKLLFSYPPHLKNVTALPWKCTHFSSDWRYVAFLQTLVALKKAGCGFGTGGSEKNRLRCVANGMSGKQCYSKCSKWPPSARYMLPVFLTTDQMHRPPRCAKIQSMSQQDASTTRPYRRLVLNAREKMKKMKNFCTLHGSAVTFFRCGGKGVTVCFLLTKRK